MVFTPTSNFVLRLAVEKYCYKHAEALEKYGDISAWNMLHMTDLSWIFANIPFDGDIYQWDTRNILNMNFMFCTFANAQKQQIKSMTASSPGASITFSWLAMWCR